MENEPESFWIVGKDARVAAPSSGATSLVLVNVLIGGRVCVVLNRSRAMLFVAGVGT